MKSRKVLPFTATKPVEDRSAIVDEYGRLEALLRETEPLAKRREVLRKQILGWFDGGDAAQEFTADGQSFSLQISAKENRRSIISMVKVKTRLGWKRFLELCTFSLTALDAALPETEQCGLVSTERNGPRRIVVTARLREAA